MAEKTTKADSNKKGIIISICAAVVAVVIIVVAIVLATRGSGRISDSFFVSDGAKYVLNLGPEDLIAEDEDASPIAAHIVYYYSGDNITGIDTYYEFADADAAEKAYNYYSENNGGAYKTVALNGNYVVIASNDEDFESLTASDVKQQIEFLETLRNMTVDSETEENGINDGGTETILEGVEETTEVEEVNE